MSGKHQISIYDGHETDTFEVTTEELATHLLDTESLQLCSLASTSILIENIEGDDD